MANHAEANGREMFRLHGETHTYSGLIVVDVNVLCNRARSPGRVL